MRFAEALKSARKAKKITQAALAEQCHVSQGTVGNWESGTRTPDAGMIARIADVLGVTADSLIREGTAADANAKVMPAECIRMIPVFESVSAGFGVNAENRIVEFIPLYIENASEAEATICVRVCGDSMHPQIQDGDLVQVMKQETAENGDIVVVLDGDDAFVKRFLRTAHGVVLESFNPAYAPMRFSREESNALHIVGVVRRIIRDI